MGKTAGYLRPGWTGETVKAWRETPWITSALSCTRGSNTTTTVHRINTSTSLYALSGGLARLSRPAGYAHFQLGNAPCIGSAMRKPVASHTFSGMEAAVRLHQAGAAELEAEELTAKMREPLGNIDSRAGDIERNSPLFFGQGDNPSLF